MIKAVLTLLTFAALNAGAAEAICQVTCAQVLPNNPDVILWSAKSEARLKAGESIEDYCTRQVETHSKRAVKSIKIGVRVFSADFDPEQLSGANTRFAGFKNVFQVKQSSEDFNPLTGCQRPRSQTEISSAEDDVPAAIGRGQ
jgi:predicted component of type VI protein secretion system